MPEQKDCGAYICCCFSSDPDDKDIRKDNTVTWQVSMCDSFCKDPCCCLAGMIFSCPTQCYLRHKVLKAYGEWPQGYTCCQSYFGCCCISNETIGKACCGILPAESEGLACCCLCLESWLCCHVAIQGTRFWVMDRKQLMPDPCDNRIIAFSNCLQCLACIFEIIACIVSLVGGPSEIRDVARIIRLIADLVVLMVIGCMTAQVNYEINSGVAVEAKPGGAPPAIEMER